jgi:hypothetical protein
MEKITKNLPCKLTDEEKIKYGHEIAKISIEIENLTEEKKKNASLFKSKIDSRIAQRREKILIIDAEEKIRPIKCTVVYNDPELNKKSIYRDDFIDAYQFYNEPIIKNESFVETEDMTPAEIAEHNEPQLFDQKESDLSLEKLDVIDTGTNEC